MTSRCEKNMTVINYSIMRIMCNNEEVLSMNSSCDAFNGDREFPENSYSTDHDAVN